MKKTRIAKMLTAATLSAAMVMSMGGMTALAANLEGLPDGITFTKTLSKSSTATTPAVVFPFAIEAATATQCEGGVAYGISVTPGVGDPVLVYGTNGENGVTYTVGDSSLTKTVSVDFSSVTFTDPGIYRYLIKEGVSQEGQRLGITSEKDAVFLDVRVVRKDTQLVIDKYYLVTATKSGEGDSAAYTPGTTKDNGTFTNVYPTYDLVLSKTLSGDMAEEDRLFTFSVSFYDGQKDIVLGVDANGESDDDYNVGTLENTGFTLGEGGDLTSSDSIQITANGTVTIKDIPGCVKYNVSEKNPGDGYSTVTYKINNSDDSALNGAGTFENQDLDFSFGTGTEESEAKSIDTSLESSNTIVFQNTRTTEGIPATGIILNFAPYILLVAFAGVFAVLFLRKRKEEF